jgi:DNA primase
VASLGTALTLDQVLLLKRFAARAILVYDSDAAGIGAAERSLDLFDQAELPVRVAVVPGESDPDAFLRREGAEAFGRVCAAALPIFDYRLALAEQRNDARTVEGKVGIVNELGPLIITVSNPVRQGEYVHLLADRLGVREEAIRGQLGRLGRGRPGAWAPQTYDAAPPATDASARVLIERELLHLLVASPAARASLREVVAAEAFMTPEHRELAAVLLAGDAESTDPGRLRERLRNETAVSLLSRFLIAEPHAKDPLRAARACVSRIQRIGLQERVDGLLEELREADRARNSERVETLKVELRELYRELNVSAQAP